MSTTGRYVEAAGRRYRMMTLVDFHRFRELATDTSTAWTKHYTDAKLKVESKKAAEEQSTRLNIIRARRVMPKVPPRVLYDQLHDASYRATWDTNMIEGFNITTLDPHNDVGYYSAKFPWPLSNRDFCNQRSWMEFSNGEYVIFNHSEPHSSCPVKKDFVRAQSFLTGYYIQPQPDGDGTLLTYVTHSDPGGSIPKSIINFAMTKGAPRLLDMCEKYSEEYPAYAKNHYEEDHVHPWTTPKMDWDSTYQYPEDVPKETSTTKRKTGEVNATEGDEVGDGTVPSIKRREKPPSLYEACTPSPDEPISVQQYRVLMQDTLDAIDRTFLVEDKIPTSRQYLIRLQSALDGIRQTL